MKHLRPWVAILLDVILFAMVLASGIWVFSSVGPRLADPFGEIMKYFTVQSNFVLGIIAFLVLIVDILALKKANPLLLRTNCSRRRCTPIPRRTPWVGIVW